MSGQRNKKPSDVIKNRQEYLDTLNIQVQLNEANEQAVKQFVATGQVPPISQMKDTRSTSQILLDVEKLKINLIKDLEPIADPQFAQQIVSRLVQSPLNIDNSLLIFTAQRIEEIVKNLKKLYKYGIKGDSNDAETFVGFINKMYTDKNKSSMSIKSFMNRSGISSMGSSSSKTDSVQMIEQVLSEFISITKSIILEERRIATTLREKIRNERLAGRSVAVYIQLDRDITNAIVTNENFEETITDKLNGLLSILPSQSMLRNLGIPSFIEYLREVDKLVIDIQGDPTYNSLISKFEQYLYFINRNIPNLDYSISLLNNYNNEYLNLKNYKDNNDFSGVISICNNIKNILQGIDNSIDVDLTEINQIQRIYNDIKNFVSRRSRRSDGDGGDSGDSGDDGGDGGDYTGDLRLTDRPYEDEEDDAYTGDIRLTGDKSRPSPPRRIIRDMSDSKEPVVERESKDGERYYPTLTDYTNPITTRGLPRPSDKRNQALTTPAQIAQNERFENNLVNIQKNITLFKDYIRTKNETYASYDPRSYLSESEATKSDKIKLNRITQDLQGLRAKGFSPQTLSMSDGLLARTRKELTRNGIRGNGLSKMSGRGLTRPDYTQGIEPSARYIKFGRYMINNKKLNDNVLSLRRSKGSTIASIPATKMTSELGNVFKKIVGGGVPSYDELNSLTDAEKKYLYKVSQEADIYDKIKIPTPCKDEEEKDIHLFNVMKGEIMAGNNSKELITKFKNLLNKLSRTNVLPKSQVREILEELLELGF